MRKSHIYVVICLMVMALLGLIVVQATYIQNTITLKEAQFRYNVNLALKDASSQIERYDALQRLKENQANRRALTQLDSIQRVHTNGWSRDQGFYQQDTVIISEEGGYTMSYTTQAESFGFTVSNGLQSPLSSQFDNSPRQPTSNLVLDMLNGVVDMDFMRPLSERLEAQEIDSLVVQSLRNFGVDTPIESAVFNSTGQVVMYDTKQPFDHLQEVASSAHSVRIFPNDWMQDAHFLKVHFPSQKRYVLTTLWPLLLTSAGLMFIIIGAFSFTIVTIFRQKKVSEIKNDFINNMTHELKTPISTISLACEALADPDMRAAPASRERFVGMIRQENMRLGTLVENVLRTAVIDRGEMRLNIEPVDVHDVIEETRRNIQLQLDSKGAEVTMELRATRNFLDADRVHLTNLLFNLMDNALKYSPESPKIGLRTFSKDGSLHIEVSDNGIGIAKENHYKVFDNLYRVPTGNTHDVKGFGLGLSYVRAVVEKHGGVVNLKSALGKGSTFTITIPYETSERT